MKEQEKDMLTKALCAYLPFCVKIEVRVIDKNLTFNNIVKYEMLGTYVRLIEEENFSVKPYLRSMSTMTDEEKKEYRRKQDSILLNDEPGSRMFTYCDNYKSIDWLNEHYFDYRGLIGKGLALEAPKGMYE